MKQTLKIIIDSLDTMDSEATIYAEQPWTPQSQCVVCRPSDDTLHPPEVDGMPYFLEVCIAKELKEDLAYLAPDALCQRIIDYAMKDA